jgi:hypothetical protein
MQEKRDGKRILQSCSLECEYKGMKGGERRERRLFICGRSIVNVGASASLITALPAGCSNTPHFAIREGIVF